MLCWFDDVVLGAVISVSAQIWYERSAEIQFYENVTKMLKFHHRMKVQTGRRGRARSTGESPEYMDQPS